MDIVSKIRSMVQMFSMYLGVLTSAHVHVICNISTFEGYVKRFGHTGGTTEHYDAQISMN